MLKALRLTATLATVVLASACGSTALRSGAPSATDESLSGGATSEPAARAAGLPVVPPSHSVPFAPAPGAGSASAPRAATSVPRVQVPVVTVKRVPVVAPKAPIRLGIIGVDAGAILDQFGKKAPDPFDSIKPMISYVNAHEGIAGHAIKPVYVRLDSKTDTEQAGQLACAALTQDNAVDLVLSLGFASETLNSCLKSEGVSIFNPGTWAADDQWLAQYPNVFLPEAIRADRYLPQMIASAVQQGSLKAGDRLGVLVEGCPWGERVYEKVIVPTAQKYGIATEKAAVTCITNIAADLATVTQDLTRDVLQLATKGATHVMSVTAAEGFFESFFSQVAGSQNYLPKYLVSSNANLFNTTDQKSPVHFSPDAVENIVGIGWQPFTDLGSKARPVSASQSAQQALCRQMDSTMGGALSDTTDGRYFKMGMFYATCDTLMAVKTALLSNGNRFGIGDMAVGFQTVLAKGVSAFAAGGRYGGGAFRHDGLSLVSPLAYSSATGRPAYTGSLLGIT